MEGLEDRAAGRIVRAESPRAWFWKKERKAMHLRPWRTVCSLLASGLVSMACTKRSADQGLHAPSSTHIDSASVKWQTIGNCWNYAVLGFIESHEFQTGLVPTFSDFSESYISYRHFEDQLSRSVLPAELESGGTFDLALQLVRKYGVMREADFIPEEATSPKSNRQLSALTKLNAKLKAGELKAPLNREQIRAELDAAFGVELKAVSDKIIPAEKVIVRGMDGQNVALPEFTRAGGPHAWKDVSWSSRHPRKPGATRDDETVLFAPSWEQLYARDRDLLRAGMKALNAGHGVVLSWLVEFQAMKQGVFDRTHLKPGYKSDSGLHMTALVDYVATGIDPETGVEFFTPEGNVPDAMKTMAENHGELRHIIVKNHWGNGFDRIDRTFWVRNGTSGYHRIELDYLSGWYWLGQKDAPRTLNVGFLGLAMPQRFLPR